MTLRRFSDLDYNFNTHPATGDVIRLYDDTAIKQSLKALVKTNFYNRPFQPALGSSILGLLFENDNQLTRLALANAILEVITNNEPRVRITKSDITVNRKDLYYTVDITVKIVGLEKTINTTLTLNRIR